MRFDLDLKTGMSLLISVVLLVVQYVQGVYAGGIDGLEWLGLLAVLFGPAGLVALANNTPWSPATKAVIQHVASVVIVVVQGVQGVYANGINSEEWFGLALLLLSSLAVYVVPGTTLARRGVVRNQAGYTTLTSAGIGLAVLGVVLLIVGYLAPGLAFLVTLGWIGILVGLVLFVLGFFVGGPRRTRV